VIITNNAYRPSIIKPEPEPEPEPEPPLVWMKGTPLPDMNKVVLEVGLNGNTSFSNTILRGMEEPGSELDSIWGFVYNASISGNNQKINYLAAGGKANFRLFGTDYIYYRIKRPNSFYFRGMIPIVFEDTAQPRAINDERTIPGSGGLLTHLSLLENDKGTNPVLPRSPKLMLLHPTEFTETTSIKTQFGILKDSIENGNKAFYYKRTRSGNQADTSFIFLQEGPENRITRSRLIIKP
jgi:hypothetical protein